MKVIMSEILEDDTIIVSANVYRQLQGLPAAPPQHEALFANFEALLKAKGLSPTGRRPSQPEMQEIPKPPKP